MTGPPKSPGTGKVGLGYAFVCPYRDGDPMCAPRGNGRAKAGSMGFEASLYFSNSASWSLLALALLFWNQILTCVSVRLSELENSALSAMERYCFWRNFLSSASNWEVVKGVRGFLLFLCFLRGHGGGLELPTREQTNGKRLVIFMKMMRIRSFLQPTNILT